MSCVTDQVDMFRLTASYVDRIRRGDKPADLPVQTTKFETSVKYQGRRGDWLEDAGGATRRRRRSDRMISLDVRYWPKADIASCTAHVRFRG